MSTRIERWLRPVSHGPATIRVLLVEDDHRDRIRFRDATRRLFLVEDAPTFSAAQARIAEGDLDVVVLDLGLPDSVPIGDMVREVRRLGGWLPLIVWTGRDDVETAVACIRAGAAAVVVKERDDRALAWHIGVALAREAMTEPTIASRMLHEVATQLRSAAG